MLGPYQLVRGCLGLTAGAYMIALSAGVWVLGLFSRCVGDCAYSAGALAMSAGALVHGPYQLVFEPYQLVLEPY